ncbi:MAG: ATP-binding cassette domain-containing protein [Alphaproteobacteria bacterium]|nr:ATP-binding cassette domain-containing protein [Alphaproteobacteria bacterium]
MLDVVHLVKHFGPLVAVDDVSFHVPVGQVLGFLGPNGAGKSTTMKMIAGFLTPTGGTATVCGHDIRTAPLAAKRQIGYLPEGAPAYPDMSAGEFLTFIANIRGFSGAEARKRVAHIAELINITMILPQPIETLSKGYRRRVGVAQALLHDPAVVILDEPTDGLDPNQKQEMRLIIRMMSTLKAIIISTHLLEEVEAICNRAIIIDRGRILVDGTPGELIAGSRYHNAVRLTLGIDIDASVAAALAGLPDVVDVEPVSDAEGEGFWILSASGNPVTGEVAALARERGWPVTSLRTERGRLDDVFRSMTMSTPQAPDRVRDEKLPV